MGLGASRQQCATGNNGQQRGGKNYSLEHFLSPDF
jgi:hypothetical protein